MGFPGGSVVKNLLAIVGDTGSINESRKSPGEENDNLTQNSCLGKLMDKEPWWAIVNGVTKQLDVTY